MKIWKEKNIKADILYDFYEGSGELNNATFPEGVPRNVVLIARMFILVVSVLVNTKKAFFKRKKVFEKGFFVTLL